MGIVIKQSFWVTVVGYAGFVIGYINSLVLYPYFMTPKQIGIVRTILSMALLIAPVIALGTSNLSQRYYQRLKKNKNKVTSLFLFILTGTALGSIIFIFLWIIFKDSVFEIYQSGSSELVDYSHIIFIITLIMGTYYSLEVWCKAHLNTIFPNLIKDVFLRITISFMVVGVGLSWWAFAEGLNLLIYIYMVSLLVLVCYQIKKKYIVGHISRPSPLPIKEYSSFSMYSILAVMGSVLILNIDIQMVTSMISPEATAIYTTAFYIAVTIDMPKRSISQIMLPIVSKDFEDNNLDRIKESYIKISLFQMTVGLLFFMLIGTNLRSIYSMIPNGGIYENGYNVVLIIAFARIIDMSFSINSEIISMSKYYKANFILVFIFGLLVFLLNWLLIPLLKIEGAAFASLLALIIFNVLKLILIRIKLQMQPFSWLNLYVLLLAAITTIFVILLPKIGNHYLDVAINSLLIMGIYGFVIWRMKWIPEINFFIQHINSMMLVIFKKI